MIYSRCYRRTSSMARCKIWICQCKLWSSFTVYWFRRNKKVSLLFSNRFVIYSTSVGCNNILCVLYIPYEKSARN